MSTIETEFDIAPAIISADYLGARMMTVNILALDLGTQLGWSTRDANGRIRHGSVSFHAKRNDGPGQRWLRFTAHLSALKREVGEFHVCYYEDVKRHAGTQAAHAYGAFESHLQVFCDINRIRLEAVGVGQIKKSWTGNGAAKKESMIAEAHRRGFNPADDNAADSLAILHYGMAREIV
jgi:Holliday junction resolvasome RuvABC endonuclease subunit